MYTEGELKSSSLQKGAGPVFTKDFLYEDQLMSKCVFSDPIASIGRSGTQFRDAVNTFKTEVYISKRVYFEN